jgi:hypothetical protein
VPSVLAKQNQIRINTMPSAFQPFPRRTRSLSRGRNVSRSLTRSLLSRSRSGSKSRNPIPRHNHHNRHCPAIDKDEYEDQEEETISSVPTILQVLPSIPASTQESGSDVAKLREHLAFTRESYQESLKELQAFQALTCSERLELDALRKLVKEQAVLWQHHQQQEEDEEEGKKAQQMRNSENTTQIKEKEEGKEGKEEMEEMEEKINEKKEKSAGDHTSFTEEINLLLLKYDDDDDNDDDDDAEDDDDGEDEVKEVSPSSKPTASLSQLWHTELQTLAKDKADCEMRLLQQCNQLRDTKYLMKQLLSDNHALQKKVDVLQQQQEQQEFSSVGGHDVLSVTMPSHNDATLQELQDEVHQWEALYFETAETGSKSIQNLEQKLEQVLQDNERLEQERDKALFQLQERKATIQESEDDKKCDDNDTQDPCEETPTTTATAPRRSMLNPQSSLDVDEIVWMERLHQLELFIVDRDATIRELQQELQLLKKEKEEQAIEIERQQRANQEREQRRQQQKTRITMEKQARNAMLDIFCCGTHSSIMPINFDDLAHVKQ